MQSGQERPYIQLPPLPDTEPDMCIHTTIRHYHHEPRRSISRCTHYPHLSGSYLNPRYSIPESNQSWTGAEDSLLLEQMPHTEPPGIRALDSTGSKSPWHEVARRMTQESRARNISKRQYTESTCRCRYRLILCQIKNQIGGNRGPDGHKGVNPYGVLIPSGYALHMPLYIDLNRELVYIGFKQDEANPLENQVNVQRIRSVAGVGKWVMPDEGIGHAGPSSADEGMGIML
ncbi:hypothetical protein ACLOAV_007957 [Pseudogymnoascus australis]